MAGGSLQTPVPAAHVPATWHWSFAVHTVLVPGLQIPLWQRSVLVQASMSEQTVPSAMLGSVQTPVDVLHVPAT
jgi:hypothetical protein